ncbi:MAG TPA: phosphatidate cytidylyltransferase [Paludibacter sp.]|nr:phosphatidate cytidylyltransferase [Paludibacter sp.]
MSNFLKRTLSGFLYVLLVVGSVLLSQYYFFLVVFALVAGFAVREFHKITNQQADVNVNSFVGFFGALLLFVLTYLYASGTTGYKVFSIYGLFLLLAIISELYRCKANPLHNWAYFVTGQVVVALPFSLLNFILYIHDLKPWILLAMFVTIWVNDTGAYLVGVSLGKHRLFERISPKKSWEGFAGGAATALVSGYVFSNFIPELSLVNWLVLSEIIVVFGTFGDLVESLMKRTVDLKDSGSIIPGHGGLLDRFDSMLLAAPVTLLYLNLVFGN